MKKKKGTEYDKIMDALNFINIRACDDYRDFEEEIEGAKMYDIVATFIEKKAKR